MARQPQAANLEPQRFGHHRNSFGFLRLLFASLVIAAHTPELADGDRHREILTRVFGTITFGEVAVDAFFLISGYLITGSCLNSTPAAFLRKRAYRIYPAFLVASAICVFIVAPLGGASLNLPTGVWVSTLVRAILLQPPDIGPVFVGTYYGALNGALWTIAYEFKCYLLVFLLGRADLFGSPRKIILFAAVLILLTALLPVTYEPGGLASATREPATIFSIPAMLSLIIGEPHTTIRLTMTFTVGCCYYLFRDRFRFSRRAVLFATLALLGCMCIAALAHVGVAVFGGLLIFAAARRTTGGILERVNNEQDVSYGVYLYAWPATKLLLLWWPHAPLSLVGAATLAIALGGGWLSWTIVERPAMRMVRQRTVPPREAHARAAHDFR